MSQDLAKVESFEERLKQRIRDSIGELLTDEELSTMVRRSVEEIFFKPRERRNLYHTEELAPLLHEIVKGLVDKRIEGAVEAYIDDHADKVEPLIAEAIKEGIGVAVLAGIRSAFRRDFEQFECAIAERFQALGSG